MRNLYLVLTALLFSFAVRATTGPITGTLYICLGASSSLSCTPAGGTWESSSPPVASITSGSVLGIAPGTTTITYTVAPGDYVTAVVTVNALPSVISGAWTVCSGATTALSSASGGGTWSSSNVSVASISITGGLVSGLTPGSTTITYAMGTGCVTTAIVTVNPQPAVITGVLSLCDGTTTTLSSATGGGVWSSINPAVAAVGIMGMVAGLSSGTTSIIYMTPVTGCSTAATVTVNPLPATITGPTSICVGHSIALNSFSGGGIWTSSNASVATIVPATGVLTSSSAGTTTVSYSLPTGCAITVMIISNPVPVITGSLAACIGSATTLSSPNPGGFWSSSDPAIAYVNALGVVTTPNLGITIITYTLPTGCFAAAGITINPVPALISGSAAVCPGTTTTLNCITGGGLWTSNDPSIAIVDLLTGMVTGVSSTGTTTISYTLGSGCASTKAVTINSNPGPVTGTANVCAGSTIPLNGTVSGGTWGSSTVAIATVNASGVVTGISAGTATISYNVSACATGLATTTVTVNALCAGTPVGGTTLASNTTVLSGSPVSFSLTGATTGCGISLQWQDSPDAGSWTNITGATSGTYNQSSATTKYYRCALTCIAGGSTAFSVPAHVAAICSLTSHSIISAADTACSPAHFYITVAGTSAALSAITYFGDATTATTPISVAGNAHIYHNYALPGTYTVKHVLYDGSNAVDSVSYTYNYLFCHTLPLKFYFDQNSNCAFDAAEYLNTSSISVKIDSNGIPIDTLSVTAGLYRKVYGPVGTIYAFSVLSPAGSLVATCPSSGVIYDTILASADGYTVKYIGLSCPSSSPANMAVHTSMTCGRHQANGNITVANNSCAANTATVTMSFSNDYTFWYSTPTPTTISGTTVTWNIASVNAFGSTDISFNLTRPGPISSWLIPGDTVNSTFSIVSSGDADLTDNVCTRVDTVKSSYDPNDIAVTPSGYILPCTQLQYTVQFENMGNDTAHNIYILDTLSSNLDATTLNIVSASAAMDVSVISSGGYNIARFDFANINLLDSSHHGQCDGMLIYTIKANSAIADGINIGNRAGIYFDDNPVVLTNSVNNITGIGPLTGPGTVCNGSTITLSNTVTGGTWSSTATGVATVGSAGAVSSLAVGNTTISYTVNNSCATRSAAKIITVNALPAPITGSSGICAGTTTTLISTTGGTWNSSDATVAIIGSASGSLTTLLPGTATITYMLPTGCSATHLLSVFAAPGAITACNNMGIGDTMALGGSSALFSVSYYSSNPSVAGILGFTPNIVGLHAGTTSITPVLASTGCVGPALTVTVTPTRLIAPITGATTVCMGSTAALGSAVPGGTWSSTNPSVASISTAGVVSALTNGYTTISYSVSGGLYACTQTLLSAHLPDPITGPSTVCVNDTITLYSHYTGLASDVSFGGTFSSADTGIAKALYTSSGSDGKIRGMAPGPVVITFRGIDWPGCSTSTTITVNPLPALSAISGTSSLCSGASASLTNAITGGTWSSSATAVVSVGTTGIITGLSNGTATISYTVTNSCGARDNILVVTVNSIPDAGSITGASTVCAGANTTLTNAATGGSWSSSASGIATVGSSGIVSGMAAGVAHISYAVTNSCTSSYAVKNVTVDPLPIAGTITGTSSVCEAATTTLTDVAPGGAWTSSATGIATVSAGGVVSGILAGTTSVSYIVVNGCGSTYTATVVTVNALPTAGTITGTPIVCAGSAITLSDASPGGTWASGAVSTATIDAGGVVTGIAVGTVNISYIVSNLCGIVHTLTTVTVNPLPDAGAIMGTSLVCADAVTPLADVLPGGAWSSTATGVATIGSTGIVTGVAAGTATISYTAINSCGTDVATLIVTVHPLPVAGTISGSSMLCVGNTGVISATMPGGSWSSTAAGIAAVGTDGVVSGISSGSAVISYTVTNDCGTDAASAAMTVDSVYIPSVTVTANPGTSIMAGMSDTLVALTTGSGPLPAYQWIVNGAPVPGATTMVYVSSSFANGDSVSCVVNGSGPCGLPGFNSVIIHVGSLAVLQNEFSSQISIYPNPNKGGFTIKGALNSVVNEAITVTVTDMLGQEVYRNSVVAKNGIVDQNILLDNTLASGMYMLVLHTQNGNKVFHFTLER